MFRSRAGVYLPEVLLEFVPRGAYVKVSAVDPRTGTEVSIVGDPSTGERALRETAIRKLEYVLAKQAAGRASASKPSTAGNGKHTHRHSTFGRHLGRYINTEK